MGARSERRSRQNPGPPEGRRGDDDMPIYPAFPEYPETSRSSASRTLLVQALLLSGKYRDALDMCKEGEALGWFYSDNPRRWVVPFLLLCLKKDRSLESAPNLESMWNRCYGSLDPFSVYEDRDIAQRFQEAILAVVHSVRFTTSERKVFVTWCVEEAGARVDAIVSGTYRKSYDKAAELLMAVREVLKSLGMGDEGIELVEDYRSRYPRHRAFQEELRMAGQKEGTR